MLEEVKEENNSGDNLKFQEGHVLWITGGTRGLGYLCAKHFIENYGVKHLVITGKEELPPKEQWGNYINQNTALAEKICNIQALESKGIQVYARSVSLVDKNEIEHCLTEVKKTMGPIGGVIHCAGVADTENPAFIRKNLNGIKHVLNPKVDGLDLLCRCLKNEPLKFMLLFSSVSAIIPSLGAGQADYAMANSFMDYFAQAQSSVMPITSIQWPNWKQAGMGEIKSTVYKNTGLQSITNLEGLQLLDEILSKRMGSVVLPAIVNTDVCKPNQLMKCVHTELDQKNKLVCHNTSETVNNKDAFLSSVMEWLISLFASELKIDFSQIEVDIPFQDYGLDSVLLAQVLSQVSRVLGDDLSPSIFYEYPTIQLLAVQLIKTHETHLYNSLFKLSTKQHSQPLKEERIPAPRILTGEFKDNYESHKTNYSTDIAIVGLSCRFPGANSLDEYWDLLSEGRSAIHKVPYERWGFQNDYYAGLLDNISDFDPQFFHIHGDDARQMDPQALMLLEESLKLWHQAGYDYKSMKGKAVGVYIGARSNKSDITNIDQMYNPSLVLGQNYLAANISNYFDLSGPSLVVDTACSSSLVGMNMAIQALRCSEIEAAIVGGISLLTDSDAHKLFKKRGILNPSDSFHIFDGRANGIVLGEGVGMVLLKTVDKAILDGDHIYSVIKGVAVNNDGRTAGPATPNIQRQKEVMETALLRSGRNASEVQYIEANGSGSEVTDLLELKSIQSVYGETGKSPIGIGSMKPNIGHPLCAEGIASLIKTVLMLHKKKFVPFLSGEQAMKHFDINTSRFYFNKKLTDWKDMTRIAAINCFADGGTNCHIIIESFEDIDLEKNKGNLIATSKLNPQELERVKLSSNEMQNHYLHEILAKKRKMIWQSFE